jgi:hypothetical protein
MVAHFWDHGGRFLYGPLWVDRPPGLIAVFRTADSLGPYGVRLVATLLAVILVAATAWGADAVGGRPAASWAAWTAFAFSSSVRMQAERLDGELVAAALVAVSVAALLRAVLASTKPAQTVRCGLLAGAAAALAVLMKQNFVDALAFAAVLLTLGVATPANRLGYRPAKVLNTAVAFVAGAAVPALVTLRWAELHGGLGALAYAMFGFRVDAAAVMASWSWAAPLRRLDALAVIAALSGLALLAAQLLLSRCRSLRRLDPLPWAVAAAAGVELVGVFAGENFWPHYLIGLVPMVALAAGLSADRVVPGGRWTRGLVVLSATATALTSPVMAAEAAQHSSAAYATGVWLSRSARPTDTVVVPFTHANVIEASGLTPAYPYAWSLPARTLDPDLSLLTATLRGPAAPTWVVQWDAPHAWGLDPTDRFVQALHADYRRVAVVCGHSVWLHDGITRHLASTPLGSAPGNGAQ